MFDNDYQSALKLLYDRINYERSSHAPYTALHYRLDRMRAILEELGNPQSRYDIIHIAGTKGKGTTANLIYDALRGNGRRVGLYTSPHLLKLEERFQCCGSICTEAELIGLIDRVLIVAQQVEKAGLGLPTFFELTTAMGMLYFANCRCDSVVMEVGLGGRLDSTNVCVPKLTLITSISLDHQAQLGSTIAEIAAEKAGIIKPKIGIISTARNPDARKVIQATAKACGSELLLIERDFFVQWRPTRCLSSSSDLTGRVAEVTYHHRNNGKFTLGEATWPVSVMGQHQADNLAGAITALNWLSTHDHWQIDPQKTREAVANSQVPGRLQIVGNNPIQIIDTAHNPASVSAGLKAVRDHFGQVPLTIVFASSRDKDFRAMLTLILKESERLMCTAFLKNPRAVAPEDLFATAKQVVRDSLNPPLPKTQHQAEWSKDTLESIEAFASPIDAWQEALKSCPSDGIVLAIGSFFLAAELLEVIR